MAGSKWSMEVAHDLYRKACKADDEWHAELIEKYGPEGAISERYRFLRNKEEPTPKRVAYCKARDEYFAYLAAKPKVEYAENHLYVE